MKNGKRWMNGCAAVGLASLAVWSIGCGKKPAEEPKAPPAESQKAPEFQMPPELMQNPVAPPSLPPDTVMATVNGQKIVAGDVDREVMGMMASAGGQIPPQQMAEAHAFFSKQALDSLIVRALLKEEVAKSKTEVTAEEVNKAIERIKQQIPEGKTLEEAVAQQGMTVDTLMKTIGEEMAINKMMMAKLEGVPQPTAEKIDAFYEENKARFAVPETVQARHILLTFKKDDTEEVKKQKKEQAEAIHKQLVEGGDFAELAKKHSDCPSKERGGDLGGPFARGQMVPEFDEAAFGQKVNEIGPVIETQFGYHIVQVTDKKEARTMTKEDTQAQIKQILLRQEQQKAAQAYIEELRKGAKIEMANSAPEVPEAPAIAPPPPPPPPPAAPAAPAAQP